MPLHRIRFLGFFALLILPVATLGQDAPAQRLPVPDAAVQKNAEKMVREILKDEYAKMAPADQKALAQKLLQQGRDTKDDPAVRYVLFQEGMDLAAKTGDVETAMGAADEMGKLYEADGLALKTQAITVLAVASKTPEAATALAEACLQVADEAVSANKFKEAKILAGKAESAAKVSKDVALVKRAQKRGDEIEDLEREQKKVKDAEKVLETNPNDPDANLVLGRYALLKGDVDKALPMLSKGAEPLLRVAADKELAALTEAKGQAEVGDAWWEAAEKEKNAALKEALLGRAKENYEKALAGLSGFGKIRVEKRLSESTPEGKKKPGPSIPDPKTSAIDLLKLVNPRTDAVNGDWSFRRESSDSISLVLAPNTKYAKLQLPYQPPEEYDFRMVFTTQEGAGDVSQILSASGRSFMWIMGGWNNRFGGFQFVNGKAAISNPTRVDLSLDLGREYTSLVEVRKTGIKAYVDDKLIAQYSTDYTDMSISSDWKLKDQAALGVGICLYQVKFSRIEVIEVTGKGRRLR